MKLLHVAIVSMIAGLGVGQSAPVAHAASADSARLVIGKAPDNIAVLDKSGLNTGVVNCEANKPKCGQVAVYAGYNPTLKKCVFVVGVGEIRIPPSTVAGGGKITVEWAIVPMDDGTYRFTDDGINIIDNDMTKDWDSKGHASAAKDVYKWRSVHSRPYGSDYIVNLQRKHPTTGAWDNCDTVDPRINNT
jgi:hypothetical protein